MKTAVDEGKGSLWASVRASGLSSGRPVAMPHELNISGDRVLVALAIAMSSMGLFLWTFVRYWLFAP